MLSDDKKQVNLALFYNTNNEGQNAWVTLYQLGNHRHWWFCWWSPEKPEAHQAGNQSALRLLSPIRWLNICSLWTLITNLGVCGTGACWGQPIKYEVVWVCCCLVLTILYIVIPPPNEVGGGVYWIHLVRPSVCPSVRPSVCRRHGFRSISQVCFGISISNFICMLMVAIGRSLLIFSDVTFKMAAWRPYWIFLVSGLTLLWLWISTLNFGGTILMYMGRSLLIFSKVIFKMATWQPY